MKGTASSAKQAMLRDAAEDDEAGAPPVPGRSPSGMPKATFIARLMSSPAPR